MIPSYDAAIVLGASVGPDGRPSPALLRRVARGVALYHAGQAGRLLMSGGVGRHPPAEADVMRDLAVQAGVPAACVLTELRSRTT